MSVLIACAGSVAPTIRAILKASDDPVAGEAAIRHGPGGLLAEAIADGLHADIYISASAKGPERLSADGAFEKPRTIAHNRICLVAAPAIRLDPADPAAIFAVPDLRIGMSTPGADPSGDYALAIIERIGARDPALAEDIHARTRILYGSRLPEADEAPENPARDALARGEVDLLFSYLSAAQAVLETAPGSTACLLPHDLAPLTEVSACVRVGAGETAANLFRIIAGPLGQRAFRKNGFLVTP